MNHKERASPLFFAAHNMKEAQRKAMFTYVVKQSPWRGTGFEVAVVERDDSEAIRGVPLIAI